MLPLRIIMLMKFTLVRRKKKWKNLKLWHSVTVTLGATTWCFPKTGVKSFSWIFSSCVSLIRQGIIFINIWFQKARPFVKRIYFYIFYKTGKLIGKNTVTWVWCNWFQGSLVLPLRVNRCRFPTSSLARPAQRLLRRVREVPEGCRHRDDVWRVWTWGSRPTRHPPLRQHHRDANRWLFTNLFVPKSWTVLLLNIMLCNCINWSSFLVRFKWLMILASALSTEVLELTDWASYQEILRKREADLIAEPRSEDHPNLKEIRRRLVTMIEEAAECNFI